MLACFDDLLASCDRKESFDEAAFAGPSSRGPCDCGRCVVHPFGAPARPGVYDELCSPDS